MVLIEHIRSRLPARFPADSLRTASRVVSRTYNHFMEDDGLTMAGHLAYIGLFSLFPFLLFVVALARLIGETGWGAAFARFLLSNLPPGVAGILAEPVQQAAGHSAGGALTFGVLGTLWTSATALEAARSILNRAYGARRRHALWRRRLQSAVLVLIASVSAMVWMALLVVGPVIWAAVEPLLMLDPVWGQVWATVRYLVSAGVLLAAVSIFYSVLPARRVAWRWVFPGAVVAVALWLSASALFSFYLSYFHAFTSMYGSLGGVMIVLFFFYVSGVIFILGAEFNVALAEIEHPEFRAPPGSDRPEPAGSAR